MPLDNPSDLSFILRFPADVVRNNSTAWTTFMPAKSISPGRYRFELQIAGSKGPGGAQMSKVRLVTGGLVDASGYPDGDHISLAAGSPFSMPITPIIGGMRLTGNLEILAGTGLTVDVAQDTAEAIDHIFYAWPPYSWLQLERIHNL